MKRKHLAAFLLAMPLLSACETPPSKENIGMATGAVLGGVPDHRVGNASGETTGGASLGAFLDSRIGRNMDHNDQRKTAEALESLPNDRSTTWRNRDTKQIYSVTPRRTYDSPSGPCRDFTTIAEINDRVVIVRGTACRQPDGKWKAA